MRKNNKLPLPMEEEEGSSLNPIGPTEKEALIKLGLDEKLLGSFATSGILNNR